MPSKIKKSSYKEELKKKKKLKNYKLKIIKIKEMLMSINMKVLFNHEIFILPSLPLC